MRDIPADCAVEHRDSDESTSEVPAVAHGDEHHVVVVFQVPLHLTGRVQNKPDLDQDREHNMRTGQGTQYENREQDREHNMRTGNRTGNRTENTI